ncbi:hypothetical protein M3O96_19365 [Aquiflexum sp. TKW24L]|uniref:hypothetical protein n=1 Tax=Aquiflexum sp. TKW24L TaxID=2942212 RepID=UPI0020BEA2BC|nr:hypothetical protein [Aquiflexum sp. TKW24L]MCL6261270.1 hypothetical protein [Aquiflexum sp. TKW24L]
MKKIFFASILILGLGSCISDIEEISETCTVLLKDGTTIEMSQDIRQNTRTGTITYRDGEGRLKSVFKEDYETFDCGS